MFSLPKMSSTHVLIPVLPWPKVTPSHSGRQHPKGTSGVYGLSGMLSTHHTTHYCRALLLYDWVLSLCLAHILGVVAHWVQLSFVLLQQYTCYSNYRFLADNSPSSLILPQLWVSVSVNHNGYCYGSVIFVTCRYQDIISSQYFIKF